MDADRRARRAELSRVSKAAQGTLTEEGVEPPFSVRREAFTVEGVAARHGSSLTKSGRDEVYSTYSGP